MDRGNIVSPRRDKERLGKEKDGTQGRESVRGARTRDRRVARKERRAAWGREKDA